jgi:hypothetical protein
LRDERAVTPKRRDAQVFQIMVLAVMAHGFHWL